jgi:hypothetical protein
MNVRWVLVGCALLASGCGPSKYPVTGTVYLEDGTPLKLGKVVFHPQGEGVKVSCAGEIENGKFRMGTASKADGVPAGTYKITVDPPAENVDRPKPPLFDRKFTRPRDTPLRIEVPKTKELRIELKKNLP